MKTARAEAARPDTNPVRRPPVSLARALSKLGLASRQDAEALVTAGRVRIDGRIVTNPAVRVIPEKIRIQIDGRVLRCLTRVPLHRLPQAARGRDDASRSGRAPDGVRRAG